MSRTDKTGRKKQDNKKIESIHISDDMLVDHEMDEFLRQSIIEEADELEKQLNSDPELVGVGASDDLFFKIKARLQEMGAWEEEEKESSESPGEERKEQEREKRPEEEESQGRAEEAAKEETGKENAEKGVPKENGIAAAVATPESFDGMAGDEKESGNIYNLLSEEDREALEIGRKVQKKEEQKKIKKGKITRYWKRMAVVAAVVTVVLVRMGMQGDAGRNWVMDALYRFIESAGNKLRVDYHDEKGNIKLNQEEEIAVWKKLNEELNIPIVDFLYRPDELSFVDYDIDKMVNHVVLEYLYKETLFYIQIEYGNKKTSKYITSEEDSFLQEEILTEQKLKIQIWNTTTDSKESYMAMLEYQDVVYFFIGQMSFQEMKEMMKFLYLY